MPDLTGIGTAIKAGAALLCVTAIAGVLWYVSHLRGEVSRLTQANANLQAGVAVANQAAAFSAQSARAIAAADQAAQQTVADTHVQITAADTAIQGITEAFHAEPLDQQVCAGGAGLSVAFAHALDGLFDAPSAGGSAGGQDGQHQAALGTDAAVPAVAQLAKTP